MKNLPPPNKKERGQSLMELAISLVVLLMLLTGTIEFGLALFQYITIRDATQEGAVYGSIYPPLNPNNPTDPNILAIKWRTMDAASDVVRLGEADVQVIVNGSSCEGQTGGEPNSIEVIASFRHPITFPFVADMIGNGSILLMGSSTNTILQPTCPLTP